MPSSTSSACRSWTPVDPVAVRTQVASIRMSTERSGGIDAHLGIAIRQQVENAFLDFFYSVHGAGQVQSSMASCPVVRSEFFRQTRQSVWIDFADQFGRRNPHIFVEQLKRRQEMSEGEFRKAGAGLVADHALRAVKEFDQARDRTRQAYPL